MPLQIRRGTEAERQSMTAPLAAGEPLYVTDDKRLYIGDSSTPGGIAVTGYADEDAVDAVGAALVAGEHQNVTFVYGQDQDVANRIDAVVDLSNYVGEISATSFQGNIIDSDNVILINSLTSTINLNGTVKGNVIPDQNETYDLGSVSNKFRDLYLSGSSLWLGNAQLTSSDTTLNLPAGSTIGGISIIVPGGDLNINIIDDSSTVLVNILTGVITAPGGFIGNVAGNVAGNVTGDITGDLLNQDSTVIINSANSSAQLIDAVIDNLKVGRLLGSEVSLANPNTSSIDLFDGVQERITFNSVTDGTLGDSAAFMFRCHKGDLDNLVQTEAGDFMGGVFIAGYRPNDGGAGSGGYRATLGLVGGWDADADFNQDYPAASITLLTGSNDSVSPTFYTFGGNGVFEAPIIKSASYETADFPAAPQEGWMVFDSTTKQFKGWNGTAWVVLG